MTWTGPLESETTRDNVLPALGDAGWSGRDRVEQHAVRSPLAPAATPQDSDDDGYADIVLQVHETPVAVVEVKRERRSAQDGLQQALRYARKLDAPLAYATNGTVIIEHDLVHGVERIVENYRSPADAWNLYLEHLGVEGEGRRLLTEPFNRRVITTSGEVKRPRPYQVAAINRVLAGIAKGKRRLLLLMATGTGKTFTALQIVSRLRAYEAAVRPDQNYRILYLADRDQLLSQPMGKDFGPGLGDGVLQRVRSGADTSREVYFATYQAMTGGTDDSRQLFEKFRPDFFQLVIVDECHRGSSEEDSTWRRVLDHFDVAVHLGLTATPRDDSVDTSEYFDAPVFTYSLRDGIADGYLAPYRVRRVVPSPDFEGWAPLPGQRDVFGREIPEGEYGTRQFERVLSLPDRTRVVARHLSGILREDPTARTMVFCVDTAHADDMRAALVAENPELVRRQPEWVVRIVGIEGEKERLLDAFANPDEPAPVVATTSRLLSTGVDIEDLKYVVLFRPVGSAIEFKQIIGRGTRMYPAKGKTSFEIIDYVGATSHFTDPGFDGFPASWKGVQITEGGEERPLPGPGKDGSGEFTEAGEYGGAGSESVAEGGEEFTPGVGGTLGDPPEGPSALPRRFVVDGQQFEISSEAVMVPDASSGRLELTEYGQWVRQQVRLLGEQEEILVRWSASATRADLLRQLEHLRIDLDALVAEAGIDGAEPLDVLLHVAYDTPQRSRAERATEVRAKHGGDIARRSQKAREVLEALLIRYEMHGIEDLADPEVFRWAPVNEVGDLRELAMAVRPVSLSEQRDLLQKWIYEE